MNAEGISTPTKKPIHEHPFPPTDAEITMTSTRAIRSQSVSRFHRIARSVPITDDLRNSPYWTNVADAFLHLGVRLNGKIAVLFAPLSDDEMAVACQALLHEVLRDRINVLDNNPIARTGDQMTVVLAAEVIAILAPTYLRVASPITPVGATFLSVIHADRDSSCTPARQWWFRSFPQRRVNWLHGHLMFVASSSQTFNADDSEWFGKNRERIIPMWELLAKDGTFQTERVAVLIENSEHGHTGVLGGAL